MLYFVSLESSINIRIMLDSFDHCFFHAHNKSLACNEYSTKMIVYEENENMEERNKSNENI